VNGDVYCGGQNIAISGTIHGDVFCAGQNVSISGKVDGSVRLAGQSVTLRGVVQGSATIAAQTFVLEKGSLIGRDLVGGAQSVTLNGTVTRDMAVGANTVTVYGQIGRTVKGNIETLTVGSTGRIGGDVAYSSNNSPIINTGGIVSGTVVRTPLKQETTSPSYAPLAFTFASVAYAFVAMLIVSLVIVLLVPDLLREASSRALSAPGRTSLIGFAAIILVPALVFFLCVSIIGFPLGMLVLLAWSVVALLSGPFAAFYLGQLILKTTKNPATIMLLGSVILLVLYFIPILGFFAVFAVYLFGVGMFLPVVAHRLRATNIKAV
jgi:cytoskeletal protein CcmA (bactofilin family)